MGAADEPRSLEDRWVLIRLRRHFKILRYAVRTVDELGDKLRTEPSTYEAHLTLKRIKTVVGRYGPAESALAELVASGHLERRSGASGKLIFVPTPKGRAYLARLRLHLEGLVREIQSFSKGSP